MRLKRLIFLKEFKIEWGIKYKGFLKVVRRYKYNRIFNLLSNLMVYSWLFIYLIVIY